MKYEVKSEEYLVATLLAEAEEPDSSDDPDGDSDGSGPKNNGGH
jgi:hypothetical protein